MAAALELGRWTAVAAADSVFAADFADAACVTVAMLLIDPIADGALVDEAAAVAGAKLPTDPSVDE